MFEKDVNQLKKLQVEVLRIFAAQDRRIYGEAVKEFKNNMKIVNKKLTVKTYDAVHRVRLENNKIEKLEDYEVINKCYFSLT